MATSHLSSASARIAWLAGILLIAALISTMEAAERKKRVLVGLNSSVESCRSRGPAPGF